MKAPAHVRIEVHGKVLEFDQDDLTELTFLGPHEKLPDNDGNVHDHVTFQLTAHFPEGRDVPQWRDA